MKTTAQNIAIVGAGIAGLAAAIRLQAMGNRVVVFEANDYPGGKLTAFSEKAYRFDMGPSLFTMPQYVEELFGVAKQPMAKYFSYKRKNIICNYFFEDGTTFSALANTSDFAKSAAKVFGVEEQSLINYFEKSKKKYNLTASLFLEKSLHKLATYFSKDVIKAVFNIASLDINTTLADYNAHSFNNEKLVQFFNRFATYNGSNPYQTPAIMSMIPHLEQYYGTYFPKGGMHQITMSLFELAKDMGVEFQFNKKVQEIIVENNKATGIRVNNEIKQFNIVVSNADVVPTYRTLLPKQKAPEKMLSQPRSSSALIFYWGIEHTFPQLDLHNIFFSEDYNTEFDYIFNKKDVHNDPTVYINITSKDEPTDAPQGCENWFTMVNVPCNTDQNWDEIIARTRANVIAKISKLLNKNIEPLIVYESILDPRTIESKTQSYQGALYGASSNNKFAAFLRHPNFKRSIHNLYFCGGSVHPGGGIPLCLLSGKIVAELISKSVLK